MNYRGSKPVRENAVLVGVQLPGNGTHRLKEHLEELSFLAATAGADTLSVFTQKLEKPNPKYFIGKGKVEEIKKITAGDPGGKTDLVIFDDDLSPSQVRNLEQELKCKILDRTGLILDIFAYRAKTAQAKAQVELAQLEYLLPRLTGMWTHLSKQAGGIGTKGPGEKEIETDRRIIRKKISSLKEQLSKIDRQNYQQRKHRKEMVRVALVGYTNAGKSTLMNRIAKTNVFAENKLFATLDTTVKKVVLENPDGNGEHQAFLLSDIVGFIRKLPHNLVECFKSTLEEVREADIFLHVVDVSHPFHEEQIAVVNRTLQEMDALNKPMLYAFNKTDLLVSHNGSSPKGDSRFEPGIFISATKSPDFTPFRKMLFCAVKKIQEEKYPYSSPY